MNSAKITVDGLGAHAIELMERLEEAGLKVTVEKGARVTGDRLDFDLGEIHGLIVALSSPSGVVVLAATIIAFLRQSRCHLIINNSGIQYDGPVRELEKILTAGSGLRLVPPQQHAAGPIVVVLELPSKKEDDSLVGREVAEWVRKTLKLLFGKWSEGRGCASEERLDSEDIYFEFLADSEDDPRIHKVVKGAERRLGQVVNYKVGEKAYQGSGVTFESRPIAPFITPAMIPNGWPKVFRVAIVTVIGPELRAAQDVFGVDRYKDVLSVRGSLYYHGTFYSKRRQSEQPVLIHCLSRAGNAAAAAATARISALFAVTHAVLMGIAAGIEGKVRIGDVVVSRTVVDDTAIVAIEGERRPRPLMKGPPHAMAQLVKNYRPDPNRWHASLLHLARQPDPLPGFEEWCATHVAAAPKLEESAIFSSDMLLRDHDILKDSTSLHEQIRIGEMESAGFVEACESESPLVPWYVVRGVSDFGDNKKSDQFHAWASYAAATLLKDILEDVL